MEDQDVSTVLEDQDRDLELSNEDDARFERLEKLLEARFANDRFREEQITRLHEELQSYKKDLLARVTHPLIHGLIRLHDDLTRATEALQERPPEEQTPERWRRAMEGFGDDLLLLLERQGVATFEHPSHTFDPHTQTAVRRDSAPDPQQVGGIAARVRPGFQQGTTVLRKERVAVFVPSENLTDQQGEPNS